MLDLLVQKGEQGIYLLSEAELKALNVVNNGRQAADWALEVADGGEYLRGTQDTAYGRGRIAFMCDKDKILMFTFYQVGDQAAGMAGGGLVHSLIVDGDMMPLQDPDSVVANKGEIQTFFTLTQAQASRIAASHAIGHAMRTARDAPVFIGFPLDIPAGASQKVHAFINNCISPHR
ncbi:hypothetical protein [Collimonas arenae]|uniref:hypothetical protein n=1 Tax=Collimonas arenae TaxID=279058 RepID=UPI00209E3351|nr:hypothetical protein [Collimonas arenae]